MPAYDFLGSGPVTGYELDQSFASHPVYLVARDAKDRLTPNETQRNTLIAAGVYVVANYFTGFGMTIIKLSLLFFSERSAGCSV